MTSKVQRQLTLVTINKIYPYNVIEYRYGKGENVIDRNIFLIDPIALEEIIDGDDILNEREKKVIHYWFQDGRTLDSIAEELGVTRERVRQIAIHARGKLEQSSVKEYYTTVPKCKIQKPEDPYKLDSVKLSVRAYNCLHRAGYRSFLDLLDKKLDDVIRIRNLGRKSFKEIMDKASEYGIKYDGVNDRFYKEEAKA